MLRAHRRPRGRPPTAARLRALLCGALVLVGLGAQVAVGPTARAAVLTDALSAVQAAQAQGYRTGVAVLDLSTGQYSGAGDDGGTFASESVVKVLIAAQLLLDGRMDGATAATAYRMITASDDAAANALYALAGGDAVLPRIAAHYGITGLGSAPATPGRWGLTQISAQGLVHLYAALARDPAVWPWLGDAMAHLSPVAADGTSQLFGLAAAAPGSAVKQGWGHAAWSSASPAVTNSTGFVYAGRLAVAVLVEGPAASYGAPIQRVLTAETRVLLAPSAPAAPAAATPSPAPQPVAAAAAPAARSAVPRAAVLGVLGLAGAAAVLGVRVVRALRRRVRTWRQERSAARALRRHQRARRAAALRTGRPSSAVVRLPDGQLVRVSAIPRPRTAARPAAPRGTNARGAVARPPVAA